MPEDHRLTHCPGCGAPLSLHLEAGDAPDDGIFMCEHGHIYEIHDPDDDRSLQTAIGADYKDHLAEYVSFH